MGGDVPLIAERIGHGGILNGRELRGRKQDACRGNATSSRRGC